MNIRSCKQKGRKLQQFVRDLMRETFRSKLESGDIESTPMSTNGVDIIFSPAAKKLIPFSIECKNQEKININASLVQCAENAEEGRIPLLIFHKNHGKVYCALEFSELIKLLYPNEPLTEIEKIITN